MKTRILKLLGSPVTSLRFDIGFARWSCAVGGLVLLGFASVLFWRHSQNAVELACGQALTLFDFGLLLGCGLLTSRADLLAQGKSLLSRWPELVSFALSVVCLVIGIRFLSTLSLEKAAMTIWLLSVIAVSLATICVGAWHTIRVQARARAAS